MVVKETQVMNTLPAFGAYLGWYEGEKGNESLTYQGCVNHIQFL